LAAEEDCTSLIERSPKIQRYSGDVIYVTASEFKIDNRETCQVMLLISLHRVDVGRQGRRLLQQELEEP
jgi:hypothetical protein